MGHSPDTCPNTCGNHNLRGSQTPRQSQPRGNRTPAARANPRQRADRTSCGVLARTLAAITTSAAAEHQRQPNAPTSEHPQQATPAVTKPPRRSQRPRTAQPPTGGGFADSIAQGGGGTARAGHRPRTLHRFPAFAGTTTGRAQAANASLFPIRRDGTGADMPAFAGQRRARICPRHSLFTEKVV